MSPDSLASKFGCKTEWSPSQVKRHRNGGRLHGNFRHWVFLGFVWAYPGQNRSRLYFSLLGIAFIYLVNVLRIATLILMQEWVPQFFDFTCDYSTTTIFYLVIFLLWMLWVRIAEGFDGSMAQNNIQDSK